MSFADSISEALDCIRCVAGVEVTYHRGSDWVRLGAVPGSSRHEVIDADGVSVLYVSRDYSINADDLVLNGTMVQPQRGDLIKEWVGNRIHTHEVMRPDGGDQVWRWLDSDRTTMRVHTKLQGEAGT